MSDEWTSIYLKIPSKKMARGLGVYPVGADGITYPITPVAWATLIIKKLEDAVYGNENLNFDPDTAKEFQGALEHLSMSAGIFMDGHALPGYDPTKPSEWINPKAWPDKNALWMVLSPDGAGIFWHALADVTGILDKVGLRPDGYLKSLVIFWGDVATLAQRKDPTDTEGLPGDEGTKQAASNLAVPVKKVAKAAEKAWDFLGFLASPITWAIVGGGLILYHLKEEGRVKRP